MSRWRENDGPKDSCFKGNKKKFSGIVGYENFSSCRDNWNTRNTGENFNAYVSSWFYSCIYNYLFTRFSAMFGIKIVFFIRERHSMNQRLVDYLFSIITICKFDVQCCTEICYFFEKAKQLEHSYSKNYYCRAKPWVMEKNSITIYWRINMRMSVPSKFFKCFTRNRSSRSRLV